MYNQLLKMGIGVHTVRKIHAILHCALNQGIRIGSINENPASFIDPPRKPVQEMAVLTESQVSQLLLTAMTNRLEDLYYLAITSGARESELLGLKLIDLDWIKGP